MAKKSSDNGLNEVVWPRGERKQALRPLAKRLDTLDGKTIAQLWTIFSPATKCSALSKEAARSIPRREVRQLARIRLYPCRERKGIARLAAAALQRARSRCRHLIDGVLR